MRNPQFMFNQSSMALLEKEASLAEKYAFRGICFILSLRWLELMSDLANAPGSIATRDSRSIESLKEKGKFLALWRDFEHQSKTAQDLKQTIEDEMSRAQGQAAGYAIAISDTKRAINQLTTAQTEQHIQHLDTLQTLRKEKKKMDLLQTGGQAQLDRMFASDEEHASGEPGTPSEQILRKMFGMSIKMIKVTQPTATKGMFGTNKTSWEEVGRDVATFVSALAHGSPGMFEIGFYGDGGHSVAVYADGHGTYSFFDPNYGVFTGNGNLNKLETDVATLLKEKYKKMNKVVVSWIQHQ